MRARTKVTSWLVVFTFLLASLGQLQRIELPLARAFYLHEVLMLVVIGITAVSGWFAGFRLPASWNFFTAWIVLSIVFLGLTGASVASPILYLLRFNLNLAFGLSLYQGIRKEFLSQKLLINSTVLSISLIAIFGWLQYFFIPDTRWLVYLGWDDHYLRLISTVFDPGFTGALLVLGIFLVQSQLFSWKGKTGWEYALHQWSWLLMLSALLFTYSRASYVAFGVGLVFLALREKTLRHIFILAVFVFAMLLLPRPRSEGTRLERTASIVSRIETFDQSKPQNLLQIAIGSGWYAQKSEGTRNIFGNQVTSHNSAPDNSFLFVFSSLGVVGLLGFLWLGKSLGGMGKWSTLAVVSLLAMSVHALFSNTLFYPFVLLYLLTVLAIESR